MVRISLCEYNTIINNNLVYYKQLLVSCPDKAIPPYCYFAVWNLALVHRHIAVRAWVRMVGQQDQSTTHNNDDLNIGLFIVYCLFYFQLKTCKNDTLSLLLIGYFFEHVINFGWREHVETTSTMPVNHISELQLYNKIIWQYNIKPTDSLAIGVAILIM